MKKQNYIFWSPPEALGGERPLPVKVRNNDQEVVAEGLTGQSIPIGAGYYWVTATLLDGREVGPGARLRAVSNPFKAQDRPEAGSALPKLDAVSSPLAEMTNLPASMALGPGNFPEALKSTFPTLAWSGDWWKIWDADLPLLHSGQGLPVSDYTGRRIRRDPGVDQLLAIAGGQAAASFAVIPFDRFLASAEKDDDVGILAFCERSTGGMEVRFRSDLCERANTLLSFMESGTVKDMQSLSVDLMDTKGDLAQSGVSALRALAAGYVMLRSNIIDGLESSLDELVRCGADMPDIFALRAELFARLGKHDLAIEALDHVISGRCPWFRSGLSYAFDRLRLYIEVSTNKNLHFDLNDDVLQRFDIAFKRLERAMTCIQVSRHISTFVLPSK